MDSSEQNNPSDNPNNPPKNTQQKKGKGRQKTTNRRIENETRRQVAFSKRRTGIFKKAYEVGTLCGAENAVLVKSPVGKAHSFGFPSVEAVANKFLNRTAGDLPTVHDPQLLASYNEELTNLESQLEWETNYKNESMRMMKEMQDQFGIPPKLDELSYEQLNELLKNALSLKQEYDTKQENGTWRNPDAAGGSNSNIPLVDPFIQEPGYVAPMVPGGYSNDPNQFNIGSGSNNSNVVVGYSNDPNQFNIGSGSNNSNVVVGYSNDPNQFNIGSGSNNYNVVVGYSNDPNQFDIGSSSNNSNVVVFQNNPGLNYPNATFFTTNTNPGFVDPFNPVDSNLGLPFQYPPLPASGSNLMSPFNFGNPSDGGDIGGTSADAQRGGPSRNGRGRGRGPGLN